MRCTWLSIAALLCLPSAAQTGAPLSAASPLQTVEDSFIGDYEGTRSRGGEQKPLAAQVFALGNDEYRIKLFPSLYDGSRELGELSGTRTGRRLEVFGEAAGMQWSGALEGEGLTGAIGSEGSFELRATRRESPTLGATPPEGAVVLFDGTSVENFVQQSAADQPAAPCPWPLLEGGVMEVAAGGIVSKRVFGDHKVHLEFRTPLKPEVRGQDRGNSGVYLQGRYEVQVLDSHGFHAGEGDCGGIYGTAQPRINMCYPPLQWQTYDIEFRAPRFDANGAMVQHARVSVWHNGVLIHENVEVPGFTTANIGGDARAPGPLYLQDHGSPVWYRNIWVVPL